MKYPQYEPSISNFPDAELPFAGGTLQFFKTQTGYNVLFKKEDVVINVCSFTTTNLSWASIEEGVFPWLLINYDYFDPTQQRRESLLDPENMPHVIMRRTDGKLWCRKCRCTIPNTANAEMRKEGCYSHSHICGIRAKGEIYKEEC